MNKMMALYGRLAKSVRDRGIWNEGEYYNEFTVTIGHPLGHTVTAQQLNPGVTLEGCQETTKLL